MGESISFGSVLEHLKKAPSENCAWREGRNGKGQFIQLQVPDENSKMTLPYIYIKTINGERVPWLASQTDLLSEDWRVATINGVSASA